MTFTILSCYGKVYWVKLRPHTVYRIFTSSAQLHDTQHKCTTLSVSGWCTCVKTALQHKCTSWYCIRVVGKLRKIWPAPFLGFYVWHPVPQQK